MAIVQPAIERKLSALVGAKVTFEKLNLSLLGGSIEAIGVKIGDILTIARVVAKVSAMRAIKGDFVVTSLTIERPIVTLIRAADGSLNLPRPPGRNRSLPRSDPPSSKEADGKWTFNVDKFLVLEGQASFTTASGYRASIGKLLLEMKRVPGGLAVTLLADSVGRHDVPIDLGRLQGNGLITGAGDLTAIPSAAAEADIELGETMKLKLKTPEIRRGQIEITGDARLDIRRLTSLLPSK